jgi:hypothetical protein
LISEGVAYNLQFKAMLIKLIPGKKEVIVEKL